MIEKRVTDKINEYLAKKQEEHSKRERSGKWNPSKFGRCFRAQYWNRKNEPITNPPDERTLRVFEAGSIFHDFVQNMINGNAIHELKIETDDILGYADTVLDNEIIDYKTQHSKAWHYMHQEGFSIIEDKLPDLLQVLFYAVELEKEFVRLVYISKDDLCIAEYVIKVTPVLKQTLEKEISILQNYWSSQELPEPIPRAYIDKKTGQSKECSYCNWKDKCFAMQGKKEK